MCIHLHIACHCCGTYLVACTQAFSPQHLQYKHGGRRAKTRHCCDVLDAGGTCAGVEHSWKSRKLVMVLPNSTTYGSRRNK